MSIKINYVTESRVGQMEPSSLSEQLINVSLEVEHSSLSEQLKNLKLEVSSMKKVMVDSFAFENQFLKIKQQLAEIIDEISTIKSRVAVVQQTLKSENDAPAQNLNCSSATQGNTSKSHSLLALDEQLKGQWLTIGNMKENFSKLQQDVAVQSLKSTEQSKISLSVIEQQKYMEGQMNLLHAKLDQDLQKQHKISKQFTQNIRDYLKALKHKEKNNMANKTLRRVKKLECKIAISLKNSRSFVEDIVEKRMQCLTESVEDNTYDIQQCWKMLEEIEEAEHYFMLNGDKVKLEDEMSRLIFGQDTLLAQSEEQMNSIVKIQDDISGKSMSEMFGWNFSHKDLLSALKDVGDKYEMMKVVVLKRFEGLDSSLAISKNFGEILNNMTKSRQVLGKQVDLLKNDVDCIKESIRAKDVNMVVKLRKFPIRNAIGTPARLEPLSGQDTMMKGGVTTNINTRHQCVTAMQIYEDKSLEELRHLDYSGMDAEIKSDYQIILSSPSPFTSFGNQVSQVAAPSLSTLHCQLPSNTKLWSGGFNTTTSTTATTTSTATYSPFGFTATTSTTTPSYHSPFNTSSSSFLTFIPSASTQISPSPSTMPKKVLRRPARGARCRVNTTTPTPISVISSLFKNHTISGAAANQLGSTTTSSGLFGPSTTSSGLFGPSTTSSGLFGPSTTSSGLFGPSTTSSGLFGSTKTSSGPSTTSSGLFGSTTSPTGLFGPTSSSSGLFCSTSSSSGLFCSTSSSSGLFGSTTSSSNPSTFSGLFGSTTISPGPSTASSGLFGSTTISSAPSTTSSGLFDSTTISSGLFVPASSSSGLFCSTSSSSGLFCSTSSSSGLFGSTTSSSNPSTTFSGLFGSTTISPGPSTASSGLFGSTTISSGPFMTSSGLFGSTTISSGPSTTSSGPSTT